MNAVESIRIKNINNGVLLDANIDIRVGQITTILGPSGEGLYDFLKPVILSHSEKIYNTIKNSQFLPTGNFSGIDNRIEGLPPVINFLDWDARPNGKVGDFVKIYPILADIFLRKGYLTCPTCSSRCNSYSPEETLDYLYERYSEEQIVIASPLSQSFTDRKEFLGELTRQGFVRVRFDGEIHRIEEVKSFISGINIEVVIDRLKINDTNKNRIIESLNTSRAISGGITIVIRENKEILQFNEHPTCIECKEMNIDLNHQCLLDNYKLNDTPWPKVSEWNIEESVEFLCTFNDDSYVKTQTALIELGLNKIAINQELKTLSLSEWQRLRLAAAVSLGLSGLLYMFRGIISCVDERIRKFVVSNLKNLTRQGNTILLVDASREGQAISESIFECRNGQFVKVKSIKQPITESYPNRVVGKPLKIFGIGEFGKIDFDLFCSNVVGISGKNSAGKSLFLQKLIQSANAKNKKKDYQIISEIKFRSLIVNPFLSGETIIEFIGISNDIAELFVDTPLGKRRGYPKEFYRIDKIGGRCPGCEGFGFTKNIDGYNLFEEIDCSLCDGSRFKKNILEVTYNGYNVADILAMPIENALTVFKREKVIAETLSRCCEIGIKQINLCTMIEDLGTYSLRLMQISFPIKSTITNKRRLFFMDDPSCGAHPEDVSLLSRHVSKLAEDGSTIFITVDHDGMREICDRIIEIRYSEGIRKAALL